MQQMGLWKHCPIFKSQTRFTPREPDQEKGKESDVVNQEPDIIDVAELMKDLEEDEMEVEDDTANKENIGPPVKQGNDRIGVDMETCSVKLESSSLKQTPLSEIDSSSFR